MSAATRPPRPICRHATDVRRKRCPPDFSSALGGGTIPEPPIDATSTGRRKALANWVGSKDNPLTARVMVNRIWQYHFGKGLVATPSDLGHRGGLPSHPELLDWMTTEFVDNGWSMKKLHKLIMTSSVYRQSSEVSKDAVDRDADNLYLSHFNRRRLSPEEIRDGMLQSSGVLNLKMGGRPVVPEVAREELYGLSGNGMWVPTANQEEHTRRSIYMLVRRTFRPAMFESFDAPDGIQSCSRRVESNTAPQSLTLLNGQWTVKEANRLAEKLDAVADDNEKIRQAWVAIYVRQPKAGGSHQRAGLPRASDRGVRLKESRGRGTGARSLQHQRVSLRGLSAMKHYSRRELLIESGRGFGALALAGMLEAAEPEQSAGAEAAAFSGARQGGDPPVHARRREPRGHVRSQAGTGQT